MSAAALLAGHVFDPAARSAFGRAYPEVAHRLGHRLADHPLLTLDALARLGEALPAGSVEYNRGDLPLGVDGKPEANGIGIGETIRRIETCASWAVLKNVEQDLGYAALVDDLLAELRPAIEAVTGPMLKRQGYVFVSSPHAVTPYHFDPEHNVLLQLRGTKTVTTFPAGDPAYAPDESHERYHTGGGRELAWDERFARGGSSWPLAAGEALYIPVMAPHHVRNGPAVSVSLSITWRSAWSFAEADARAFNGLLRRFGLRPRAPGRYPAANRTKSLAWRAWSRAGGGVGRVFGGQVIAQALAAAERTVAPDREAHSLHAYFLRGGSEDHEIEFRVERDLDGGSFSNRRVVASQLGKPILNLVASFHKREEGVAHQDAMPDVPPPEELPSEQQLRAQYATQVTDPARRAQMLTPRPIELRPVEKRHWMGGEPSEPRAHTWFRAIAPLPDDPKLHRAVLAYASDMTLLGTCALPHGLSWTQGNAMSVSLDHVVWFHDDFRADEWLLYATDSPWAGRARGMNRGRIFTRDGRLVANVAQEGLLRRVEPKS